MGANAQTTVPTFTAGEVLTAAQQNASARTGVPVFATTITRDAGFGGTGEKTLAEGQLCYVEGTGLQSYNGTSWVTWGTAPSSGAFVKVVGETAFTTASQIDVDNCFTSTYTNYMVQLTVSTASTTAFTYLRLRVGGSTATTNYNTISVKSTGASVSTTTDTNGVRLGETQSGVRFVSTVYVYSPQLAVASHFTNNGILGSSESYWTSAQHSTATAYDGLSILPGSGTITGFYAIYGFAKS